MAGPRRPVRVQPAGARRTAGDDRPAPGGRRDRQPAGRPVPGPRRGERGPLVHRPRPGRVARNRRTWPPCSAAKPCSTLRCPRPRCPGLRGGRRQSAGDGTRVSAFGASGPWRGGAPGSGGPRRPVRLARGPGGAAVPRGRCRVPPRGARCGYGGMTRNVNSVVVAPGGPGSTTGGSARTTRHAGAGGAGGAPVLTCQTQGQLGFGCNICDGDNPAMFTMGLRLASTEYRQHRRAARRSAGIRAPAAPPRPAVGAPRGYREPGQCNANPPPSAPGRIS